MFKQMNMCFFIFFWKQKSIGGLDVSSIDGDDCFKFINNLSFKNWKDEEFVESIRDRFVIGDWFKVV